MYTYILIYIYIYVYIYIYIYIYRYNLEVGMHDAAERQERQGRPGAGWTVEGRSSPVIGVEGAGSGVMGVGVRISASVFGVRVSG